MYVQSCPHTYAHAHAHTFRSMYAQADGQDICSAAKREAMWPRQLPPGGRAGTALAYSLGRVLSCGCGGWVIGCTYIRTQTPTYLFIQSPTYLFREFRDLCGCDDPFRMTLNCTYHLHTYSTYEVVSNLIYLLDCRRGEVSVVTCMWWGVVWES